MSEWLRVGAIADWFWVAGLVAVGGFLLYWYAARRRKVE